MSSGVLVARPPAKWARPSIKGYVVKNVVHIRVTLSVYILLDANNNSRLPLTLDRFLCRLQVGVGAHAPNHEEFTLKFISNSHLDAP
jgi:hypothetical protein